MFETVKIVNGYEIKRMIGTKGFYHVIIRNEISFKEFCTFRTIKAAAEFCKTL